MGYKGVRKLRTKVRIGTFVVGEGGLGTMIGVFMFRNRLSFACDGPSVDGLLDEEPIFEGIDLMGKSSKAVERDRGFK